MTRSALVVFSLFAICSACGNLGHAADRQPIRGVFQYAAKFICGENPTTVVRVLPGQYATAINIHNPNPEPALIRKNVALTFPPAEQMPSGVSQVLEDTLESNQALEVDCEEIPAAFFDVPPNTPYTKGFLVIESLLPLNVTAVYTAGSATAVQSLDIEMIPGTQIDNSRRTPATQ